MRMVKVVLGIFILFLGIYFYLAVREIAPSKSDYQIGRKNIIVEKISSKMSSKRLSSLIKDNSSSQSDSVLLDSEETDLLDEKTDQKSISENNQKSFNQMDSELDELGAMTEDEIDQMEVYFDEVEKNWKKEMSNFILNDLGLSHGAIEEYERLRDEYEEEKLTAMEEFHEKMEEKHGESYLLEPNQEQEYFQNKVQGHFFEKIKKVFGEEGFDRYLDLCSVYNDKIKGEQDLENGAFLIEC